MGWLRKLIANYKKIPMTKERAMKYNIVLTGIYFMTAWSLLGYTIYYFVLDRHPQIRDDKGSLSSYYANLYGFQDVTVYRVKGLADFEKYTIAGAPPKEPAWRQSKDKELTKKDGDEDLKLLVEETSSL